ncbi:hypothetical protein Scep_025663 [Stephania cephalantha]|uniref:Uncharacterized protein n=1 Tax=Stephania cephalantha TaxID=152367 RepID=A0AAP0ESK1_9MAGN
MEAEPSRGGDGRVSPPPSIPLGLGCRATPTQTTGRKKKFRQEASWAVPRTSLARPMGRWVNPTQTKLKKKKKGKKN